MTENIVDPDPDPDVDVPAVTTEITEQPTAETTRIDDATASSEEVAAEEPAPSVIESSVVEINSDPVVDALQKLAVQVERFHERSRGYEDTVRNMQMRIDQLQGDQIRALFKPLIQRLAAVHAHADEASAKAVEQNDSSAKEFDYFRSAIEEALNLIDIESVGARVGERFHTSKHHAARAIPTGDSDLDKTIQRVLRQGFSYTGATRTLLPAQVSVYKFDASLTIEVGDDSEALASPLPLGAEQHPETTNDTESETNR